MRRPLGPQGVPRYGEAAVTPRDTVMLLLPVSLSACVRTVDLRAPGDAEPVPGDATCVVGERVNPNSGECEPCDYINPRSVCPCGFISSPAPFPACEGPEGTFSCLGPCRGDITACTAYGEQHGQWVARDCEQLRACCDDLAQDVSSTPCCAPHESLLCVVGSGEGDYPFVFRCVDNQCCETSCDDASDCDTTFQSCHNGRCVPGCDTAREVCIDDGECQCRPLSP